MATRRKPRRKPTPTPEVNPVSAVNTFAATPCERPPDSEAVRITKECEDLTRQIESHRRTLDSLRRETHEYEQRINCALLNHAGLRNKLAQAVQVPVPLG